MIEEAGSVITFLMSHGYVVIFVWMFLDQAGLPMPSVPLLIGTGVVAASGALDLTAVVLVATAATLLADVLWYVLGRYGGARAVDMVCKLSLEPQSCVSKTRNAFGRFGPGALVIAKYLPGVQTLAPASAGFVRASVPGFLLLDLLGTLLFLLPFIAGGYWFEAQLMGLLASFDSVASTAVLVAVVLAAIYLALKIARWIVFLRGHRLRRLSAEELLSRLDLSATTNDGHDARTSIPTTVIDLRQRLDYALEPRVIPGSLRIPIDEVPRRRREIPEGHDVALVCT